MFKTLILQAQHNLSDARMEFMIRDRLSWMRFLCFDLGAPTPDELCRRVEVERNELTVRLARLPELDGAAEMICAWR